MTDDSDDDHADSNNKKRPAAPEPDHRRREANRLHALKSRQRSKQLLTDLQASVDQLQKDKVDLERQNTVLRAQVDVLKQQNAMLVQSQFLAASRGSVAGGSQPPPGYPAATANVNSAIGSGGQASLGAQAPMMGTQAMQGGSTGATTMQGSEAAAMQASMLMQGSMVVSMPSMQASMASASTQSSLQPSMQAPFQQGPAHHAPLQPSNPSPQDVSGTAQSAQGPMGGDPTGAQPSAGDIRGQAQQGGGAQVGAASAQVSLNGAPGSVQLGGVAGEAGSQPTASFTPQQLQFLIQNAASLISPNNEPQPGLQQLLKAFQENNHKG